LAPEISTPGKVAMRRMTPVFSQFSGRLVQLRAEVGDHVRAGQVLGTIDSPDIVGLESDYQQSLAALASARTSFELAKRTRERAE
ncbi:efflux RND transporter periplasmic adaptor subunit, partial [Escherichia coli]|nr:efflux RND transporter periplasmic adaptor subunit [Escherichia coli]